MAAQSSNSKFLLICSFFLINISLFLSTLPFASSLSFNFTSFNPSNTDIIYDRAFPTNQAIELTGDDANMDYVGRAMYSQPLHLWDKVSGNLSSFQTNFSFVIDSRQKSTYGDGLTFFFAPVGSKFQANISRGSGLGIGYDPELSNATATFFAVEFDIYSNLFDPPEKLEHVGIDISSMRSIAYSIWKCDIKGGKKNHAWIKYDSVNHNLSVTFTGFDLNGSILFQHLHHVVDLRMHLPERVTFGFSAATGFAYATHTVYSWSFESTLDLTLNPNFTSDSNLSPRPEPSPEPSPEPIPESIPEPRPNLHPSHSNGSKAGLAVGLGVVGAAIIMGGLVLVWIVVWKKRMAMRKNIEEEIMLDDSEFERGKGPRRFSYKELARATNNFKEDKKLGKGGFGDVYKGFLSDLNCDVAVKRISKGSKQGIKEYASEVKIISQLRHRNLVQLIGWCHEKGKLLLVYEFMPNGSLDAHLFKENNFLTWECRYRIAQGIASGLLYLHEEWEKCVVHRDIKSSNVMLDSSFNAKLGDFGLARLVDHNKGSQTTLLAGTIGYLAPECATTGRASKESDVYSFGMVALEISCGRKPFDPNAEEEKIVMVEWVWKLYGCGKLLEGIDSKLIQERFGDEQQKEEQMERLMVVGLWCAHPDSNCRPSIRQAINVMNFEAPLPLLPSQLPVPTYEFLPIRRSNASSSPPSSATQNSVASHTINSSNFSNVVSNSSH
ncbi:L-type lectin-domain containing receptor kinase IX.1, partial [Cucurbita argyrosperma subsp. sororia]